MVLQLVSDVAKSDEGWNTMTDALVDDAVELALDEVMKDKTYAMLLKTKLGASTVEEVRAEVKKQPGLVRPEGAGPSAGQPAAHQRPGGQ